MTKKWMCVTCHCKHLNQLTMMTVATLNTTTLGPPKGALRCEVCLVLGHLLSLRIPVDPFDARVIK